jgi:hypothetical protein
MIKGEIIYIFLNQGTKSALNKKSKKIKINWILLLNLSNL